MASTNKDVRLSIRISDEEKNRVKEVADSYGMTVSEFVLQVIRLYSEKRNKNLVIVPKKVAKAS